MTQEARSLEWQRMVSDAIILERAAGVLERRGNGKFAARVLVKVLRRTAAGLRRKARRDGA